MKVNKKIILIGRTRAGKTTLCQYLNQEDLVYHKTQTVHVVNGCMIDTPGEYLERTNYRGALMVTSADADVILFVQDATEDGTMFPPAYAGSFAKHAIGIVTKSDIATKKQLEEATEHLEMAGVKDIFITSSVEGTGFDELFRYLDNISK
ncbi:ethanolamine utilization protein EutP [Lachnotalea glycerini]|uniref:Ethanolamine utilization protein EutP n=1 Tax=Lachnotalea glycerini TaxID=1763509 RepID=A0A318EVN4_9FIRM|nr:EutP/PduV family microcompartment system protein [Lachnotalea glycerini]PXV93600.1 ethanolamine utilization protein EutP [Lachnotalea glycerini]